MRLRIWNEVKAKGWYVENRQGEVCNVHVDQRVRASRGVLGRLGVLSGRLGAVSGRSWGGPGLRRLS